MTTNTNIYEFQALDTEEIEYLKSLSPVVAENGLKITTTMYNYMFETYPEVKEFFNMTNQFTQRQPKVLAFSLYQYITHLDNLAPLKAFINQIVVKHCGLGIQPAQYKVVETCLIHAFKEVLGDAVDTKFVTTFGKAYANLAHLLIEAEKSFYASLQWEGFKNFKVTSLVKECSNVTSVYLSPEDNTVLKAAQPGQYLAIRWTLPGSKEELSREYSISKALSNNEYRISVRLIPGGKVSTFVNEDLKVGDIVRASSPVGNFTYDTKSTKSEIVLFAGGIGITPLVSIIEAGLQDSKNVKLHYSNKSSESRPFKEWLQSLQEKYPSSFELREYLSESGKKISPDDLKEVTANREVYLLGPVEYMDFIQQELKKSGVQDIKLEYFGPTKV